MTGVFDFASLNFEVPQDEDEIGKRKNLPIYTADLETDPFKAGRYPNPFVAGFYDGKTFLNFWGPSCVDAMFAHIETLPPGIIYIHNGGRFDIYYMMKHIRERAALIINGRIVRTYCKAKGKKPHEIRDSYAIMPFALEKYKKTKIDYSTFEAGIRERPEIRQEIVSYLKDDCRDLWTLCQTFVEMFGPKLTVGSTAMGELKKFHSFENLGKNQDKLIREPYYYGGRVECFQRGIIHGNFKVYDVNSMYPYAMKSFEHPLDTPEAETTRVRKSTCFVTVEGRNYGAFPVRTKQGLRFDIDSGVFNISIHEFNAAIDCGLFEPTKIRRCLNFSNRGTFEIFVDYFYSARNKAKVDGDDIRALFYKYILNSAYGKFAQDSSKYLEYCITDATLNLVQQFWRPIRIDAVSRGAEETYIVWSRKPSTDFARMYNVATGASITGASRSVLMRTIAKSDTPLYCDTDSLICKSLDVAHGDTELGAWKLECEADEVCIAGKKLYALFKDGVCVKQANKGVKISGEEIRSLCKGEQITYRRDAPSYHLDGSHSFIERRV